jgi:hypothetical protein
MWNLALNDLRKKSATYIIIHITNVTNIKNSYLFLKRNNASVYKQTPVYRNCLPPLWSSGQSSWLQIQRSRVRFPALPDFLRSSGSGTGSTQPREDN